jgi:small subunit ribosomal protein S6
MIYELALITKAQIGEENLAKLMTTVKEVIQSGAGEVLIEDDWGVKTFAQKARTGDSNGHYVYYVFKCDGQVNAELTRRLGINEHVIKNLIVALGEDKHQEKLLKHFKSPFSKRYHGSLIEEKEDDMEEMGEERKRFSRKRMTKAQRAIVPDWKDPKTFAWMINEFGKIAPARISGISLKHQRSAAIAIKRARQLGICSATTNAMME